MTQEEKIQEWQSHTIDAKFNLSMYLNAKGIKFEDLRVMKSKKTNKFQILFGLEAAWCSENVSKDMSEGVVSVREIMIEHHIPQQGASFWYVTKSGVEEVSASDVLEE